MKKIVLVLVLAVTLGVTFTSCKKDKKADATEETTGETASADQVYQCPMDCEHGKSYTEAGKCPVCEMDLKAKKAGEEVSEHKHDGECTKCPEGECKCEGDKVKKECTKCPEGKCTCDKDAKAECTKCGHSKAECTCPKDKA